MINTGENNLEDIKILTKSGEIQDLDLNKISSSNQESTEYKKNVSEMLIFIKQNSNNEEKENDALKFIENYKDFKFNVSIEYDDDGLTKIIRAKIQDKK